MGMASLWRFDPDPSDGDLAAIAGVLRRGGVVVLPTDTLYGLHADARNAEAIARIQACKARDGSKPLLVLCASLEQAQGLGVSIDPETAAALEAIWPAPLTAILPLQAPVAASAGAATIGVRIPALGWLRRLAAESGPLASTSVNYAGEAAALDTSSIPDEIVRAVDGIADAGRLEGKASTIVDLTTPSPRLIRQGEFEFSQELWKRVRKSL